MSMTQLTVDQAMSLAIGHLQQGRAGETVSICQQILQVEPAHKDAIVHLGIGLHSLGRLEEARAVFERGVQIDPAWPQGWNNLGVSLRQMGRLPEAMAAFRKALELSPDFPDALSNLGNALHDAGDPVAAVGMHQRSIALRPDFVSAHCNLANALKFSGRIDEAIAAYRRALELSPNDPAIHHYLGMTLMLNGQFDQGLNEHEWRTQIKDPRPVCWDFPKPRWDGSSLQGKTILLHAEQGFGDTIQFVRYAPLVAGRGGGVVLMVQAELRRLLQGLPGVDQVIAQTEPPPPFDIHCPLMSLPHAMGTTAATIPAPMRYLHADPQRVSHWRRRVDDHQARLKVGLVWAGQRQYTDDQNRSLSLTMLEPLAISEHIRFFSLQKGPAAIETQWETGKLDVIDWSIDLTDFAETAALIENMDLVISVDTAVAHLAGALGKPVWILLPFVADWRWTMKGQTSPWYPSARLFRQEAAGRWANVIERLVQSLKDLV